MIDDGPMRHLSFSTREKLCRKFNLNMGNNPLPLEGSPTINLTTHEPVTLACARPNSSCFLDCIHYLLTGKPHKSTRLQAELIKQQLEQSSRYQSFYLSPFNPGKSLLNRGIVETDPHVLAQLLGVIFTNTALNKTPRPQMVICSGK